MSDKDKELDIKEMVVSFITKNDKKNLFKNKSFDEILDFKYNTEDAFIIENINNALSYAYNKKYGNWEKVNDIRVLSYDDWCLPILDEIKSIPLDSKLLSIGANDGRELSQLLKDLPLSIELFVNDISNVALEKCKKNLIKYNPTCINGDFLTINLRNNKYDAILSLRTINSSGIHMEKMLETCISHLAKHGVLILSVSNGYLRVDNKGNKHVLKGMLDYSTNKIDKEKPYQITESIKELLYSKGFNVCSSESFSEIFIIAKNEI